MTLEDLKKIPLLQTALIAETAGADPETLNYIIECLNRFYSGDYGEICAEDTEANNRELTEGFGHILAKYNQAHKLINDIYIESHFDKHNPDNIDYTNTLVMYIDER